MRPSRASGWLGARARAVIVVSLPILLSGCQLDAPDPATPPANAVTTATVARVIDGDTLVVRVESGGEVTVRVLGIDAPETRHPDRPVECWGLESSVWAATQLAGRAVTLRADPTQDAVDRYGRTLAYVELPDGSDFSTRALRDGHAIYYQYRGPVHRAERLRAAEADARARRRGLWGPPCHRAS